MEKVIQRCSFVAVVVSVCFVFITQGYGAIGWWGDVQPPDPSTWTSSTYAYVGKDADGGIGVTEGDDIVAYQAYLGYNASASGIAAIDGAGSSWSCSRDLYVGYYGRGTLNISNGGNVSCSLGNIGRGSGSTGQVSVDGEGSSWNCSYNLYVGCYGQGVLDISNGGNVNVEGETWVASEEGSSGQINFDNGTLTTGGLLATPADLTGTGVINTHGIVSDIDLVFDSTHGTNQTMILNSFPDQNITINLSQDSTGSLGVGYGAGGTLTIKDGVSVESHWGYLGYKSGSVGHAYVDGVGSSWNCDWLVVGYYGQGMLEIRNGGNVSRYEGCIGFGPDAVGTVAVDGEGSTWSCSGNLYVGYYGQGTLGITNGGNVSCCYWGYIGFWGGSTGEVSVDGAGSSWSCSGNLIVGKEGQGTLNISNGGNVSCDNGYIGRWGGSMGEVSVDGEGSTWSCSCNLYVGFHDQGALEITNGGLVKVGGTLTIDWNGDDDSFIRMATGGMLALYGDADTNNDDNITIDEFLAMVSGTDEIEYWDGTDWSNITNAMAGEDYSIEYHDDGDLAGDTVLTVTAVPEPATLMLLLFGIGIVSRKNRK